MQLVQIPPALPEVQVLGVVPALARQHRQRPPGPLVGQRVRRRADAVVGSTGADTGSVGGRAEGLDAGGHGSAGDRGASCRPSTSSRRHPDGPATGSVRNLVTVLPSSLGRSPGWRRSRPVATRRPARPRSWPGCPAAPASTRPARCRRRRSPAPGPAGPPPAPAAARRPAARCRPGRAHQPLRRGGTPAAGCPRRPGCCGGSARSPAPAPPARPAAPGPWRPSPGSCPPRSCGRPG